MISGSRFITRVFAGMSLLIGMSFGILQKLAACIAGKRKRTERHSLIKLHVVSYDAGLSYDDTCAVVDEETAADAGSRMDVYPAQRVYVFIHHSGNEWYAEIVQMMGNPVDCKGLECGVADYDFAQACGRRVSFKSRFRILLQHLPYFPQIRKSAVNGLISLSVCIGTAFG